MKTHVLYIHRNPITGIPFYVGIGNPKRPFEFRKFRAAQWLTYCLDHYDETNGGNPTVEILQTGLTIEEAHDLEVLTYDSLVSQGFSLAQSRPKGLKHARKAGAIFAAMGREARTAKRLANESSPEYTAKKECKKREPKAKPNRKPFSEAARQALRNAAAKRKQEKISQSSTSHIQGQSKEN